MADEYGFTIEGWEEFVENFSKFVDQWDAKKAELLMRMGNIYHEEIILIKKLHNQLMDLIEDAIENERVQINSVADLLDLIELDLMLS